MRLVTPGKFAWIWSLVVRAQDLAFVRPTKVDASHYNLGNKVEVEWTTPFEYTNLEIWQGPRLDSSFAMSSLLSGFSLLSIVLVYVRRLTGYGSENASADITSFTWKAKPLDDLDFLPAFHFRLQRGDGENFCDGCIATSIDFRVSNMAENGESVLSSSSKGKSGGLSGQDKLMIGLSIGIASAVVIAFLSLVCCTQRYLKFRRRCCRRKRLQAMHPDWLAETSLLKEFNADREDHGLRSQCYSLASTKGSRDTDRPKSYLEAFEFEDIDGELRPGWEALFLNAYFDGSGPERWRQPEPDWPLVDIPGDVLIR